MQHPYISNVTSNITRSDNDIVIHKWIFNCFSILNKYILRNILITHLVYLNNIRWENVLIICVISLQTISHFKQAEMYFFEIDYQLTFQIDYDKFFIFPFVSYLQLVSLQIWTYRVLTTDAWLTSSNDGFLE